MKINKLNLLLSIIIAFAAWVYVVYNVNPTMTRTYQNVNVQVTGTTQLSDSGAAISNVKDTRIDVKLRARRSVLDEISTKDIEAAIDVSGMSVGSNEGKISITVPKDTKLIGTSAQSTTVTVEKKDTKTVKLIAVYKTASSDEEPMLTSQSKDEIKITGAESLVASATAAEVVLDNDKVTDSEKTFRLKTYAVNSNGDKIKYLTTSPKKVKVTAVKAELKTVKLNVNTENDQDEQYQRKVDAPSQITIKGKAKDLKNITSVDTKSIDLSGITQDTTMDIEYDLPDGVAIANSSMGAKLTIKVSGVGTRTFSVAAGNITVTGLSSGLSGSAQSSATVTVTGTEDQLSRMSAANLTLTVNASGLAAGQYSLTPSVRITGITGVSGSSSAVTVNIYSSSGSSGGSSTGSSDGEDQ